MNKFRDKQNRFFTTGMFKETSDKPDFVVYTLEEARQYYLDCEDITGYQFAINYLDGWKHWIALHNSPTLEPILQEWEDELEIRLRSKAIQKIMNLSLGEKGYQAAKYLADKGWKLREAGRPSKNEVERNVKQESRFYKEFEDNILMIKR